LAPFFVQSLHRLPVQPAVEGRVWGTHAPLQEHFVEQAVFRLNAWVHAGSQRWRLPHRVDPDGLTVTDSPEQSTCQSAAAAGTGLGRRWKGETLARFWCATAQNRRSQAGRDQKGNSARTAVTG